MTLKKLVSWVGGFVNLIAFDIVIMDHVGHGSTLIGPSMQPILNPKENDREIILNNRWSVRNYQIQRGDIVGLRCPIEPQIGVIKRVIALEGDTIRTLGYKEPYVTVPQGHCWVEGDNREVSLDSNTYGPVPVGLIVSKVTHVVWPLRCWRRLSTAVPADRAPLTAQDLLKLQEEGTCKLST